MGYYVRTEQSTFTIKAEHIDEAFTSVKGLDSRNELDTGGMSKNYDEKWRYLVDVLEELGFDCKTDENGNITLGWYDSKSGNEDVFLEALAPFSEGAIEWVGEDGERWITGVANKKYFSRSAPTINLDSIIAEEESR